MDRHRFASRRPRRRSQVNAFASWILVLGSPTQRGLAELDWLVMRDMTETETASHEPNIVATVRRILAEHEHAADHAVTHRQCIGNCEWSPTMRGIQPKPNSFSGRASSPYHAFNRLTAYLGKLCHHPVSVRSCSRYSFNVACALNAFGCGR
jgi:hypothetical protein